MKIITHRIEEAAKNTMKSNIFTNFLQTGYATVNQNLQNGFLVQPERTCLIGGSEKQKFKADFTKFLEFFRENAITPFFLVENVVF